MPRKKIVLSKREDKEEKLTAKGAGLKSVLVFDEKVVVTSFADARAENSANIEQVSDFCGNVSEEMEELASPRMFKTTITEDKIDIQKASSEITIRNPAFSGDIGKDYVGLKQKVEEKIFGKKFVDDNLHIQIAYNILDIKKILSTYINNIVYIFYNLSRGKISMDEVAEGDAIGMFMEKYGQTADFFKATRHYLVYFGDLFRDIKEGDSALEHNLNAVEVLSRIRNICLHGADKEDKFHDAKLFSIKSDWSKDRHGIALIGLLDQTYEAGVKRVNEEFENNSKNNLYILSKVYSDMPVAELKKAYYEFTVIKDCKNMGLNLRQLREIIIEKSYKELNDKKYDTFRGKLYTILDFIVYREVEKLDDERLAVIDELRTCGKSEEKKKQVYTRFATCKLYSKVSNIFSRAISEIEKQANIGNNQANDNNQAKGGKAFSGELGVDDMSFALSVSQDTEYFVKLLYFMSKFLDGKEINELFNAMINKFDNIADLISIFERCNERVCFYSVSGFNIFNNSRAVAKQLRIAKNIAAWTSKINRKSNSSKDKKNSQQGTQKGKSDATYSEELYLDALALLGENIVKFKRGENGNILKDADGKGVFTEQYKRFKDDFYGKNRNKSAKAKRNFIANNVLKSKWFFYVVKYNSPSQCARLLNNKKIVEFVLKGIDPAQIDRYYKTVKGIDGASANVSVEAEINELAQFISNMKISSVLDDWKRISDNKAVQDKEKLKGLVRLYLTASYLLTKSLVKVNTRFSIAYAVLERDHLLTYEHSLRYSKKEDAAGAAGSVQIETLSLTKRFYSKDKKIIEEWNKTREKLKAIVDIDDRNAKLNAARTKMLRKLHWKPKFYNEYIAENLKEVKENGLNLPGQDIFTYMRNNIMHLAVMQHLAEFIQDAESTSYYGLYCYVLQQLVLKYRSDKLSKDYLAKITNKKNYSIRLMTILNLPFAYNLARYKNLSFEKLFYDEEYSDDHKQKDKN